MRKLEERKRLGLSANQEDLDCDNALSNSVTSRDGFEGEIDVVGDSDGLGGQGNSDAEEQDDEAYEADTEQAPTTHRSPFSIDSLLQAPKVPRGRRPNSKYPRVQASKSMNPLAFGMMPLFPPTQPVGFQVAPLPSSPYPASRDIESPTRLITHGYENLRGEDYEMRREEVKTNSDETVNEDASEKRVTESHVQDDHVTEEQTSRDSPNAAS